MTTALTCEVVIKGMCGLWLRGLGWMILVLWGEVAKDWMIGCDEGWTRYIDSVGVFPRATSVCAYKPYEFGDRWTGPPWLMLVADGHCQKRGVAYPRLLYLRRGKPMLFDVRVPLVIRPKVTNNR